MAHYNHFKTVFMHQDMPQQNIFKRMLAFLKNR